MLTGSCSLATAVLTALYRCTRFGLATRAAAEDETKAMLRRAPAGPSCRSRTRVLAALIAGSLGVARAPMTQLDPTTIPLAVVPALGAALLARFTSFGIVAAAGTLPRRDRLACHLRARRRTGSRTAQGCRSRASPELDLPSSWSWRPCSCAAARCPSAACSVEARLPAAPLATPGIVAPAVAGAVVRCAAFLIAPLSTSGRR